MPEVTARCPLSPGAAPGYPSVSPYWQEDAGGYARAEREQALSHAPLLVYFATDWCGYCKAFDREVLGDAEVDRYLRSRRLKVKVNPEHGPDERALADRFGNTGYPDLYLVLPTSVMPMPDAVVRVSTTLRKQAYDPPRFVRGIQAAVDGRALSMIQGANMLRLGGNHTAAIQQLDRVIALAPGTPAAYEERAQAYDAVGELARALDDLAGLLAFQPHRADAYGRAADMLERATRHDEAVACWSQMLEVRPTAAAWLGRSRSHLARGDRRRARADAQEACRTGDVGGCQWAASL